MEHCQHLIGRRLLLPITYFERSDSHYLFYMNYHVHGLVLFIFKKTGQIEFKFTIFAKLFN